MSYLLSAAEYAMPESYMMLQKILDDLANIEGIACYSLFQLPFDDKERRRIYKKVLTQNKEIHFALESLMITKEEEVYRVEEILKVGKILPTTLSAGELREASLR
jgi:sporadic carbohydrate cluster protein (TIGR04323 family)